MEPSYSPVHPLQKKCLQQIWRNFCTSFYRHFWPHFVQCHAGSTLCEVVLHRGYFVHINFSTKYSCHDWLQYFNLPTVLWLFLVAKQILFHKCNLSNTCSRYTEKWHKACTVITKILLEKLYEQDSTTCYSWIQVCNLLQFRTRCKLHHCLCTIACKSKHLYIALKSKSWALCTHSCRRRSQQYVVCSFMCNLKDFHYLLVIRAFLKRKTRSICVAFLLVCIEA